MDVLIEEAENLAVNVLATSLHVVHDSIRSGQNQVSKLTRGQQVVDPLFDIVGLNVESRRNDSTLVETAIELNHNLASAVVVNHFEFSNVSMLWKMVSCSWDAKRTLHDLQKLDDNLAGGTNHDLSLSASFSVADAVQTVVLITVRRIALSGALMHRPTVA